MPMIELESDCDYPADNPPDPEDFLPDPQTGLIPVVVERVMLRLHVGADQHGILLESDPFWQTGHLCSSDDPKEFKRKCCRHSYQGIEGIKPEEDHWSAVILNAQEIILREELERLVLVDGRPITVREYLTRQEAKA